MEPGLEKEIGAKYVENLNEMLPQCDVVVVNTPLTEKKRGMFNRELIGKMKKGVLIVNNARGAIMERQAVVEAVESGHIGGYSGDVCDPQPATKDHPWRYMPNQAMNLTSLALPLTPSYDMWRELKTCWRGTLREKTFLLRIRLSTMVNLLLSIVDRQAMVEAVESGHIGGYSGDVWDPHPWRYMPNQSMTPHISGTTIDA